MEATKWDFLKGAGIVMVFILAPVILKKFFNMTTSGAIILVIVGIIILSFIALLIIEYLAYRARKKQSGIETKKLV